MRGVFVKDLFKNGGRIGDVARELMGVAKGFVK